MFDLPCGLRLRAFRAPPERDLDLLLDLYNHVEVAPLITSRFIVPRGEAIREEMKNSIDKRAEMFCMIETKPPTVVGSAPPQFVGFTALWGQAERGNRAADYSIVLLPQFWNKGYGKAITKFMIDYAFVHLNMHRISLIVYEGNDRAMAVYRKTGFVDEGCQRKARWANGKWNDIICMGILAEEWADWKNEKGQ